LGSAINSCPGNTVTLDAGTGYTYDWSTGATTQTITVNASGIYSVTLTDINLCEAIDNVSVSFYPATTLTMSSTPESGTGTNDGTATVTPTGTSPYSYLWSGGQ